MIVYIYALKDPKTNIIKYIGKTKNKVEKRLTQHLNKSKYKKGKRSDKENWLFNLINEGKKPIIEILEEANKDNWVGREIYWIAKFKNSGQLTNISDGGDLCSDSQKRRVAKIDFLTLNVIEKYKSLSDAEDDNNIKYTRIIDCCVGNKTVVGGYIWRYLNNDDALVPVIKKLNNRRKVGKFDLYLNLIEIYPTLESTNRCPGGISSVCLGKTKTCEGYIWRYLNINNNIISPEIKYNHKTVSKLDELGNILKIYRNPNQAHIDGYNPDLIIKVCNGKAFIHRGYKWKYNNY